ncbi:trimethylamine methyltransferase family protein [Leisingera sp. McT4-56]|uniref:trimethylamine methyltransferase family protein n=1 Tax=Leisingera sp. McT4-56 TaxID=2881255 RepID=UPI001CF814A6|nr:trimethylamine methyltransferase family protein [Leisingera sp. McT4-56]MCB4458491.1 trimethylamine methyltransferase family protein [Leisingera sp. McT4-56]
MRRARSRRRSPLSADTPASKGPHSLATPAYTPLTQAQVDKIVDTAVELLATSGVVFEPGGEADSLLRNAGCSQSDDGIVTIPETVTRRALETAARKTELWDRNGENPITIDCNHTWFMPGMTCIAVYDEDTGEPRPSTREDLALITRIADKLPNVDGVCIAVKNVEESNQFGEIDEFACLMENTTKPLEYLCEHPSSLDAVIEMAAALRRSHQALRQKPYFLHLITPLPVNLARIHSDQIITAARAGIPVSVGTLPIGGASSPITLAGCITHALMTDFAAIVLGQLAAEGSFCVGSSDVNFMEPATGAIGSFSQTSVGDMAMCQVRRALGFPSLTGIGGCSVARRFNQDAVWEISSNMTQMFYNRPATIDYMGSLDQGLTYSLHALLLCDDLAGLLRKMWQGLEISADQMAVDLIREVGPTGNFLAHQHTVDNCRTQVWNSRYFGPNIPLSNTGLADQDLLKRIEGDLKVMLAELEQPELPPETKAAVSAISNKYRVQAA